MKPERSADLQPGSPTGGTAPSDARGWASAVIAVAMGLLAVFNATSIRSWVAEQPAGPASLAARRVADDWWTATAALGFAAPREAVTRVWAAARTATWPGGKPPRPAPD